MILIYPILIQNYPNSAFLIHIIIVDLSFLFGIFLAIRVWKKDVVGNWAIPKLKELLLVCMIALTTFIVYPVANPNNFFNALLDNKIDFVMLKWPNFHTKGDMFFFLSSILIGPFLEEILYRKIIFSKIKENYSLIVALLFSSFMFSLGHLDFDNFFQLFLLGILYGYVYYKTNSVVCGILFHSLWNLFIHFTTNYSVSLSEFYYLYTIIYLLCFFGLVIGLKRLSKATTYVKSDYL